MDTHTKVVAIVAVVALLAIFLVKPKATPSPRQYTSADYQRAAVAACSLPTHRYTSATRVSRHTMRCYCACGDYRDRRM